ncbi:hypothetical protein [Pseudomaricurvus hydrocarbonicus]|nr:hypothetical protein [Aestuariicella hydrocarbonica]
MPRVQGMAAAVVQAQAAVHDAAVVLMPVAGRRELCQHHQHNQ